MMQRRERNTISEWSGIACSVFMAVQVAHQSSSQYSYQEYAVYLDDLCLGIHIIGPIAERVTTRSII